MSDTRKIKYKKVMVPMPHCPVCGEMLLGNNSIALPYKCSCGTWDWNLGGLNYTIINEQSDE